MMINNNFEEYYMMNFTLLTKLKVWNTALFRAKGFLLGGLVFLFLLISVPAQAQFEAPEFEKVSNEERAEFKRLLNNTNLTGQGLYESTNLDDRQTNEIRARLQAEFGNPTQKLEDLIHQDNFRPGKAIQFEYWFTVNDSIPFVVLDWNGPFGSGLTYGGASKYVDLMPEIKREFVKKLMGIENLGEYEDYFYSPEKQQWYQVSYKEGRFQNKKIESPQGMSID